jgi:hypothetical protein
MIAKALEMEAKSRQSGGLPEKPKFNGDVVCDGHVAKYVEREYEEDVYEENSEETRKYLGTRVEWEGNVAYLKEVFEGDKDETVQEIGGKVQPKEIGKVVWRDNVAYYDRAKGSDDSWDDTRYGHCQYEKPKLDGQTVWTRVEDRWDVTYE